MIGRVSGRMGVGVGVVLGDVRVMEQSDAVCYITSAAQESAQRWSLVCLGCRSGLRTWYCDTTCELGEMGPS